MIGTALSLAQRDLEIVNHVGEATSSNPVLSLLICRLPPRQIVRHETLQQPGSGEEVQAVEHLALRVPPQRSTLAHQHQV